MSEWFQQGVFGYLDNIAPVVILYPRGTFDHWSAYYTVAFYLSLAIFWLLLIRFTYMEIRSYIRERGFFVLRVLNTSVPWDIEDRYIHNILINNLMFVFNQFIIILWCLFLSVLCLFAIILFFGSLYLGGWITMLLWSFLVWPVVLSMLIKYRWQIKVWFKAQNH